MPAGLTAVITGAAAAPTRNGSPRHVAMLTAFYVGDGPRWPLLDHLSVLAFWLLPRPSAPHS